jgi:hypothetical protein
VDTDEGFPPNLKVFLPHATDQIPKISDFLFSGDGIGQYQEQTDQYWPKIPNQFTTLEMRAFPILAAQIFINNPRIEGQTVNVILKSRHGIPYNSKCIT